MTHKHGRTDANQAAIVEALRTIGASIVSLADLGDGVPDLLVGFRGQTLLLEVKDGMQPRSKRRLTPAEAKFFDEWRGLPPSIVYSPTDAVRVVTSVTQDDDVIPF